MKIPVRILIAGAGLYLTVLVGQAGMVMLGLASNGL